MTAPQTPARGTAPRGLYALNALAMLLIGFSAAGRSLSNGHVAGIDWVPLIACPILLIVNIVLFVRASRGTRAPAEQPGRTPEDPARP